MGRPLSNSTQVFGMMTGTFVEYFEPGPIERTPTRTQHVITSRQGSVRVDDAVLIVLIILSASHQFAPRSKKAHDMRSLCSCHGGHVLNEVV
jgi:hypothetical protein